MPFMGEVAASRGEVLTRNAASETGASTGEMARAKATDVSATEPAAHMSAAAEPAAHMGAATEPAGVSTAEADTVSTAATSTARKRVSGQSTGESGSRRQDDHGFT
jgi:hypothetical protein